MGDNSPQNKTKSPTVRQTMGFLFAVIAGNFVSDYMKDAYEILHHDWTLGNLAILIGAAVFIMKQISDCFLYYQDFSHYEPESAAVSTGDYIFFFFDNTVEFAVLLFSFGGIYEFKNVDANRQITTHALRRFLAAGALTELCWFVWDLSFIARSVRHQSGLSGLRKLRALIVVRWLWCIGTCFSGIYLRSSRRTPSRCSLFWHSTRPHMPCCCEITTVARCTHRRSH